MSKTTQNKLIPKLRFPEFENTDEWKQKKLWEVCEINPKASQLPDEFVYIDLESVEKGKLLLKKITKKEDAPSRAQRLLAHNDIVFQMVRPYQKNNYYFIQNDKYEYVASTGYAQLRAFESSMFLYQLIHTDSFVNKVLQKCIGSNYPAINSVDLSFIPIEIPSKPEEQQKIAACLSSLDDLITAENQKLETLKAHKNGLLQNLFPVDGETVPKLRFKEFEESEDWEDTNLGQICNVLMCKRIFSEETNEIGGVPFYKIGTLGGKPDSFISRSLFEEYKTKYNYPKKGEILITCSGTVGKCLIFDGKDAYYQDSNIVWLDNPTLNISNIFLYYLVSNVNWSKLNSTTITRIYGSDLRELKIKYPKNIEEQTKIASSLISIDEILSNQKLRIEVLKKLKKGLLEGLFPTT